MPIEMVADYACVCGEGPLWHPDEKRLYWTDIETGRIFWFDPKTGRHEQCYQGPRVGGFTLQEDGKLLLLRDKGNIVTFKDGRVIDTIVDSLPPAETGRFNDEIADPQGRGFAGTIVPGGQGRLYRIDTDGSVHTLLTEQGCPNGMAFSKDQRSFYYTNTPDLTVWQFDYDKATGQTTNKRAFIHADKKDGYPDGMTIDADDHFWSARWDGSCVIRYSPQGEEVSRIELPTLKVSSITFGGDDYTDIYLTTAGGGDKAKNGQTAGALYRVTGHSFRGRPEYRSRVGL